MDNLIHPTLGEAGVIALTGYAVVFFGLVLLMIVVWILGKVMVASRKKPVPAQQSVPAQKPAQTSLAEEPKAIGSAGQVALYDVPDREAAMIMAIVAEKLQKPLNELRFISIKEVAKP